jgi:hypothetical protein
VLDHPAVCLEFRCRTRDAPVFREKLGKECGLICTEAEPLRVPPPPPPLPPVESPRVVSSASDDDDDDDKDDEEEEESSSFASEDWQSSSSSSSSSAEEEEEEEEEPPKKKRRLDVAEDQPNLQRWIDDLGRFRVSDLAEQPRLVRHRIVDLAALIKASKTGEAE